MWVHGANCSGAQPSKSVAQPLAQLGFLCPTKKKKKKQFCHGLKSSNIHASVLSSPCCHPSSQHSWVGPYPSSILSFISIEATHKASSIAASCTVVAPSHWQNLSHRHTTHKHLAKYSQSLLWLFQLQKLSPGRCFRHTHQHFTF